MTQRSLVTFALLVLTACFSLGCSDSPAGKPATDGAAALADAMIRTDGLTVDLPQSGRDGAAVPDGAAQGNDGTGLVDGTTPGRDSTVAGDRGTVADRSLDARSADGKTVDRGTVPPDGKTVDGGTLSAGGTFQTSAGGVDYDDGLAITEAKGGGFIATGYTMSFVSVQRDPNDPKFLVTNSDLYVVKVDASGKQVWQQHFGDKYPESGRSIIPALDGGYIIAGEQLRVVGSVVNRGVTFDKVREDGYVLKIEDTGTAGVQKWSAVFGTANDEEQLHQVIATKDGNYLACGRRAVHKSPYSGDAMVAFPSLATSQLMAYVVKFDKNGKQLWEQTYSGPNTLWDYFNSITETDDGYIAVGATSSFRSGPRDTYVVKIDKSKGTLLWQYNLPGKSSATDEDYANRVIAVTPPSGPVADVMVVGITGRDYDYVKNTVDGDIRLMRVSGKGVLLDDQIIDVSGAGKGMDEGLDIVQVSGGFVVLAAVGYDIYLKTYEESFVQLFKVDNAGKVLFRETYGKPKTYSFPGGLVQASDGGFSFVGSTQAFLKPGADLADDVYLVKTNSLGKL